MKAEGILSKNFSCKAIVLSLAVALCFFVSCSDSDSNETETVNIIYESGLGDDCGYWSGEGGSMLKQKIVAVPKGSTGKSQKPESPVRPHYDIAGWYLKTETGLSDVAWLFTAPINKPITLVAKWKYVEASHTVIFLMPPLTFPYYLQEIGYGEKASAPKTTWSYKIIWCTDENFKYKFDFDTPIVEDITLYGYFENFTS